jgi:hypothetical protein
MNDKEENPTEVMCNVGYYVAYRTSGKGTNFKILSRRFPAVLEGFDPMDLRKSADDWARWEQLQNPLKNVFLVQVLEEISEKEKEEYYRKSMSNKEETPTDVQREGRKMVD